MTFNARVMAAVVTALMGIGSGLSYAQVTGAGEAYSLRLEIGGDQVFQAGDTAADGGESATDPGEFFDQEEGVIIPADPVLNANAGPSATRGNIRSTFNEVPDAGGVLLPPYFVKSEGGRTTATVLPAQLPGMVSLVDVVTRD